MKRLRNMIFVKRKMILYLSFITILTLGFIGAGWQIYSQAAGESGIWLEYKGERVTSEVTMNTSAISLNLASSGTQYEDPKYRIRWEIPIKADRDIIEFQDDAEGNGVRQGTGADYLKGVVKAKKPGSATLDVFVLDATGAGTGTTVASGGTIENMTIAQHVTITINVVFAIDTELDSAYQYVYSQDTQRSLILYTGDRQEMKLSVGKATEDILWQSGNQDVVEISNTAEGVYANAVGCGMTTISADGRNGNDSINVYVVPKVSNTGAEGSFSKTATYNISSGDWIYTDAEFSYNKTLSINDKMIWVISKYDDKNQKVVIEDSLGNKKSDLIELTTVDVESPKNLKVTAKAGQYTIDFYPAGTYKDENTKSATVVPTTIIINVYARFDDRQITLNTDDKFSLYNALNITQEEFLKWFTVDFSQNDVSYDNYLHYDATQGILSAEKSTENKSITVQIHTKSEYRDKVNALLDVSMRDRVPTFTFRVTDELLLNMRNVSIIVGQEMQLIATTATYEGELIWTSSDEKYVKVSDTGVIKGLAKTIEDVTVTVSQQLSDGSIKTASCKVKVEETVKNMTLSETEIELLEGDFKTIVASFKPDRNEAPLQWMSSDPTVFSINISTDKKSVVVNAKKAGTAVLTALNEQNYVTAVCKVTVFSQITKISLPQSQMTVKLNREVIRMVASTSPTTATDNRLVWDSSDPSIASVNASGLVTLLKAGTTIITVKPEYNTSPPIMAQCVLTVEQSSTGIKMNQGSITLEAGENYNLSYVLTPTNATTTVVWKSMDSSVAVVTAKGEVTAKKAGTTYIVVTSADGYSAECKVTVTQDATGIKLSTTNLTLGVGDSYAVDVTITPQNATDKRVTWTSQNTAVAKVTSDGKVTGVAVGTTIIAAKIKTGEVAYLSVTVKDIVKSLSLDQTKKTIAVGKAFTLTPVFKPANASNQKVTWSSSDSSVATVTSAGRVRGVKGGTAMIVCTAEDGGYTAHCVVTVEELVTEVKLNHSSYNLPVKKSVALKATVTSNTAGNKKVKWTTSNKKIATVTTKGLVTAKKVGSCTIKASATDGSGEYATCSIRVIRRVSSLKISNSYIQLLEGKSKKLKTKVSPSSASIKGVKWSSSDTSVAVVGSSGKVHALSEGIAKITVSTTDGSKIKATCTVKVIKAVPVTALTVSASDITMVKGTSQSASVSVSPSNTTDKISYSSDAKSIASVTSKGKIKAKRPGVATITATSTSGKQVCINVTVVGLNKTSLTLEQYDSDELWVEEVSDNVRWYSSDPSIARVSNGTVVARKVGRATITASVRGVKLRCSVQVKKISK